MPKIVDHAERRAEVVEVLLDLIAQEGYAAVSSRSLAKRLGVSNGALWRYFRDKEELLEAAYRAVVEQTNARAQELLSGLRGLAAVRVLIDALLPLTPISQREARVVVSFWGACVATTPIPGSGRAELLDWERSLSGMLQQAVADGELDEDAPIQLMTTMLLSYTVNAQLEFVFQGAEATRGMAATVERFLLRFAPTGVAAATITS